MKFGSLCTSRRENPRDQIVIGSDLAVDWSSQEHKFFLTNHTKANSSKSHYNANRRMKLTESHRE